MATGVFAERLDGFKGPFGASLVCQEFYETDSSRGFGRGYQMQLVRSDGPLGTSLGGYLARVPWGAEHHRIFLERFAHTASLTVTTEDLPEQHNRITLDPTLTDSDGIPAPRVSYRVSENARKMIAHGLASATRAFKEAGAHDVVHQQLVDGAGFHLLGTARMGNDPATSVVDADCRSHEVPNLLVVDGSVWVTAGALNPTSTIQAIALRAADRLLGRSAPAVQAPAEVA
jgi:choline dehydrogenase-like flavoprotein